MALKLGVLDQTHISQGRDASQTLAETTLLAQEAERLGYSRFWVTEHHSMKALASSSPEVLIAHVAAKTEKIKVGSGGVMLTHYSAYKVAENFRLLEALHPGRIDLGIGRAPGGMPLSTRALQEGKRMDVDNYPEQVDDLTAYLHETLPRDHRFAGLLAAPTVPTAPELWLLGSSYGSAQIAAAKGTAYAYAQFFGVPGSEVSLRMYRDYFKPSMLNQKPKALAAVLVICADTDEEADRLATGSDLFFLSLEQGKLLSAFPSVEFSTKYPYTDYDRERIRAIRENRIIGSPETVRSKLLGMSERLGVDEFLIVTMTHSFEARLRSYRLVAEAFGLSG